MATAACSCPWRAMAASPCWRRINPDRSPRSRRSPHGSDPPSNGRAEPRVGGRLEPHFTEQIDQPAGARGKTRMVRLELHGGLFQPVRERDAGGACLAAAGLEQALDVLQDLREQRAGPGVDLARGAQFLV